MNKFRESLKVEKPLTKQEQLAYEEHKRQRFAKEVHKEKWKNARKRMKGEER